MTEPQETSQYFAAAPAVTSAEETVRVRFVTPPLLLRTDRGVFSHGRLDAGTELLLRQAPGPPAEGNFLDLGCGAGPIALTLARRAGDAHVVAIDVNERARALCAANAARNGVTTVTVAAPDSVDEALCFDLIWSNPPIRIGKGALHDLLTNPGAGGTSPADQLLNTQFGSCDFNALPTVPPPNSGGGLPILGDLPLPSLPTP